MPATSAKAATAPMATMTTGADDALLRALDAAPGPVHFFIRDDDAGWDDERLMALLDTTAALGVPIDLAVIPQALSPALAGALCRRMDVQPLGVHQHGWCHDNHEPVDSSTAGVTAGEALTARPAARIGTARPAGRISTAQPAGRSRKSEFGPARPATARRSDLQQGRERLRQAFGARLDDCFTPPWNRCAADTPAQLADLGFAALSRDHTAPAQTALPELPVHTDWCRLRRQAPAADAALGLRVAEDLARHVGQAPAIGLMLHHAVMQADELAVLAGLLQAWTRHPNARWHAMRDLLNR